MVQVPCEGLLAKFGSIPCHKHQAAVSAKGQHRQQHQDTDYGSRKGLISLFTFVRQ